MVMLSVVLLFRDGFVTRCMTLVLTDTQCAVWAMYIGEDMEAPKHNESPKFPPHQQTLLCEHGGPGIFHAFQGSPKQVQSAAFPSIHTLWQWHAMHNNRNFAVIPTVSKSCHTHTHPGGKTPLVRTATVKPLRQLK